MTLVTTADVTFPACRLAPYSAHGEGPQAARSGEAFEERPGKADPRQGGAAGCAASRSLFGGTAQPGNRPRPRRCRLADGDRTAAGKDSRISPGQSAPTREVERQARRSTENRPSAAT